MKKDGMVAMVDCMIISIVEAKVTNCSNLQ